MKFSNRYAWLLPTLALAGLAACALATGGARPAPKAHPKAAPKVAATATVTYAHDIAPILYQNCTTCHRTGEVAPFTLSSYGDAKKRARQIALVTAGRVMPPWKADSHGEFQDERRLTDGQIALLQRWAEAGAPEGKAAIDGPWGLALSGLAGAASVTTGFLVPADPVQDHTPNGGTFYAEYVAGVNLQKQINDNNAAGTPDTSTPRFIPSDPASVDAALADIAAANGQWDQDKEFNSGNMRATEFTGYSTTVQGYQGDAYDVHGYVGPVNGSVQKDMTLFYVFTWYRDGH